MPLPFLFCGINNSTQNYILIIIIYIIIIYIIVSTSYWLLKKQPIMERPERRVIEILLHFLIELLIKNS